MKESRLIYRLDEGPGQVQSQTLSEMYKDKEGVLHGVQIKNDNGEVTAVVGDGASRVATNGADVHKALAGQPIVNFIFDNGDGGNAIWDDTKNAYIRQDNEQPFRILNGQRVEISGLGREQAEAVISNRSEQDRLKVDTTVSGANQGAEAPSGFTADTPAPAFVTAAQIEGRPDSEVMAEVSDAADSAPDLKQRTHSVAPSNDGFVRLNEDQLATTSPRVDLGQKPEVKLASTE